MSTKRQPSKQRRQTQNQKQRAALEARREAAAAGPTGGKGDAAGSSPAASNGSVLSRFRGSRSAGRAARTGGSGSLPVGHRAALSALLAAVAAALVGSFLFRVPVGRDGEPITTQGALVAEWSLSAQEALVDDSEATAEELSAAVDDWLPGGSEPYIQAFWPVSLTVLLPVVGTALGFRAVSKRSPAKVVNRTMYVTLFGALLASQLLLIFLPAMIALAVAAFQVRKAEVQAQAEARAAAPADDVIDVEEVTDAEVVDAEVVDAEVVDEVEVVDDPAEEVEPR
jgi:hypothetical protein